MEYSYDTVVIRADRLLVRSNGESSLSARSKAQSDPCFERGEGKRDPRMNRGPRLGQGSLPRWGLAVAEGRLMGRPSDNAMGHAVSDCGSDRIGRGGRAPAPARERSAWTIGSSRRHFSGGGTRFAPSC